MRFTTKTTYKSEINITGYHVTKKAKIEDGNTIISFDVKVMLGGNSSLNYVESKNLSLEPTITEDYLKKLVIDDFNYNYGNHVVEDVD